MLSNYLIYLLYIISRLYCCTQTSHEPLNLYQLTLSTLKPGQSMTWMDFDHLFDFTTSICVFSLPTTILSGTRATTLRTWPPIKGLRLLTSVWTNTSRLLISPRSTALMQIQSEPGFAKPGKLYLRLTRNPFTPPKFRAEGEPQGRNFTYNPILSLPKD